jgi:hypothetical protein
VRIASIAGAIKRKSTSGNAQEKFRRAPSSFCHLHFAVVEIISIYSGGL